MRLIKEYKEKIIYDFSDYSLMLKRIIIDKSLLKYIKKRKKKSAEF
jgi:hypothetical protein